MDIGWLYLQHSETLRENFAALSDTEQDQSVPLTDQLKVAKAAIAARHNRIFLQDYDTYQAKLTAKNAAHVTLREKEQELKRLYTFELLYLTTYYRGKRYTGIPYISLWKPDVLCNHFTLN
jgi:hypothetical protein